MVISSSIHDSCKWYNIILSYGWIKLCWYYASLFHLSVDGQLDWFHGAAIKWSANIFVLQSFRHTHICIYIHICMYVCVGIYTYMHTYVPRSGIWSFGSCKFLETLPYCFLLWLHHFTFPAAMHNGSLSHTLGNTCFFFFKLHILCGETGTLIHF